MTYCCHSYQRGHSAGDLNPACTLILPPPPVIGGCLLQSKQMQLDTKLPIECEHMYPANDLVSCAQCCLRLAPDPHNRDPGKNKGWKKPVQNIQEINYFYPMMHIVANLYILYIHIILL